MSLGQKGDRKAGSYEWYEIQDNVAYYRDFEKPKIIHPVMAKQSAFVYDESGYFGNDKCFFIPTPHKYLIPILNSRLLYFWLTLTCTCLESGSYEYRSIFMENLPIVEPTPAQQAELETYTDDSRFDELNALVYEIYGLTPEEIAIVEDHTKDML